MLTHDATVFIPSESRIGVRKIQITGMEKPVKIQPAVRKIHIVLPKPSIYNITPDFERLLKKLNDLYGTGDVGISYDVLKELPEILRRSDWNATVTLWEDKRIIDVEEGDAVNALYGLAVDIGTSKVVGYLVDLSNGEIIGSAGIENPQITYGEDFMSRIEYTITHKNGLRRLQRLTVNAINDMLHEMCMEAKISPRNIYEATIVGNTVMHHIFLGIQPKYLSKSPYQPAIKRSLDIRAKELGLKINPSGNIHVLPVIAGYVGADAVADVLATGIYEEQETCLLIDIGTNGEVFVGNKDDIVSCSCAAGPAFEGAHIKHGMKAITGAIEKVRIDPKSLKVSYEVVGNVKPVGICGSGL